MASPQQIKTTVTDLLKINHPILLAGMGGASGAKLVAAVTNAGGMGVFGGNAYTPEMLRNGIAEMKSHMHDKNAPFGVDLLIPKIGGGARATNYDYNKGKLDELTDIVIETGARLFVCAIGIPPKSIVDKLHKHGVLYMNMVGHPKHIPKALENGADLICAQGGEGGGHTGHVPLSVLIPEAARLCEGKKSAFTGLPVQLIAAGGIANGQTLAASLAMGAAGVWVGTRFVLSEESNASEAHKEAVRTAGFDDTVRTIIFSGRPLRVRTNPYVDNWEQNRQAEIKELTDKGILPAQNDLDKAGDDLSEELMDQALHPYLMGQVAALCNTKMTAKEIVDDMVAQAVHRIDVTRNMLQARSKL